MRVERIAVAEEGSALQELYRQHAPRALALAFFLTGDWYLAEDLVQEAFVRVTGRFRYLRNPAGFESYLRRAVVNLHRSLLRRRRLERDYLDRVARTASPQVAFDPQERDDLIRALKRLPSRQRAAVVLRYCMDLSEVQVAEALNCSTGAAKSLVARGVRALRKQIRGEHE